MCIFALAFRVVPDCPVLLLTNREESTQRPTLAPQESAVPGRIRWFGGQDARAKGTWFGVNERGLVAAVTNRTKSVTPANVRSRGLLCRDVLERAATPEEGIEQVRRMVAEADYAGFNLILISSASACVVEMVDQWNVMWLYPGIHTVGNGPANDTQTPRVIVMQRAVEELVETMKSYRDFVVGGMNVCRMHGVEARSVCLHGEGWGTVGSTIVVVPNDRSQSLYHYADGPPCATPYCDYSAALCRLFEPRTGSRVADSVEFPAAKPIT